MNTPRNAFWSLVENGLPWFVLAILLVYTYAKFFEHPYGFRWSSPQGGIIIYVFDKQPEPTLRVGDKIIQIGELTWEEFQADLRQTFFQGARPGDNVSIVVERGGQRMTIAWKYPGFNRNGFLDQLVSEWFMAYFFWLAGTLTILYVRPKDDRWILMALFNFLTAIWLIAGSGVSTFHVWNSALVLRMAVILCVPVYWHLHWIFPRPLGRASPITIASLYGIAFALVIAQALQLLPSDFFFLAFVVALGGSIILLFIHILRQPPARRALRLLFVALLAIVPALIWEIVFSFNKIPASFGGFGLLSLTLLPLVYLYSAFRRRLGGMELRVNRFFSIYLFVTLLGTTGLPLIGLAEYNFTFPGKALIIGSVAAILTTAICIWGYPRFQSFVESRILGIPLPSKQLLEAYSTRITTSILLPDLIQVLHEDVLSSLLVRQFAFLQLDQGSLKLLSTMGLNEEQIPKEEDVPYLMTQSGIYRSPDVISNDQPFPWVRLALPLKLGDQLLGFWLLGQRDPDDIYSQVEIPVLNSLANLTAIALSNILQTERLKSMYETNINRYEQERLRLALDLHDSILNELAALLIRPDAPALSPKYQQAFDGLTERLREIVNDLRPPTLAFGLKLALEDFAESLMERNQDSMEVVADVQADADWRYAEVVESNLYRIVQEACENALRYARAKKIVIFGRLHQKEIDLRVEDDGIGFRSEVSLKLDGMLANKHFGLVGMLERANLIGAVISINSKPGQGTKIQVTWES